VVEDKGQPLRLAFRVREGVVRWWRTRPPPPACILSKGGVGVVGDRDGPSDSRFERGRGRVVVEDKTTKKCESGRGGGWLGTRNGPSNLHFERGSGW